MRFAAVILALSAALGMSAQDQAAALSKAEIEQIVRQYILDHPEVIIESVQTFQERERLSAQQRARQAITAKRRELFEDPASPVAGDARAPVPLVQFVDYNCGYCKKVAPTVTKLLEQNPKLRIVFKEFPILGPESQLASRAALAAHKQGSYVKFHRALMEQKSRTTQNVLDDVAGKLGLDVARLKADMDSPAIQEILTGNQQLAAAIGVQATPSFVIGSELVPGAVDLPAFQALIDKALEEQAAAQPAKP